MTTPFININAGHAIDSLGIKDFVLYGEPKNESEFNSMFRKVVGKDSSDTLILSSEPNDFGVSWEQVELKIIELQAEYDSNQYQRDRAEAYPSWQDQLDTIYHQGIDVWKAQIKAIKDQHPKP